MGDKHSSKKIAITIAALVVAVIATTGLVLATHSPQAKITLTPQTATQKSQQLTQLQYQGQNGKTALALLKQHAQVATKQSSLGEYVDSINGVKGGTNGKYWTFYVNGQEPNVGAGAYITKNGDMVEWKLQ